MVAFTDDTGGFAVMVHCWVCYTTPRAQGYGGTGANVRTMADLATEVAGFDLESVGNAAGHTALIQDVIWNSCATERDKDGLCGAHAAAHDDEVVPVEVQKARSDILCRVVQWDSVNDTFTGISWVSDVRDNFVGSVVKCKGFNLVIGFSMIHARRADKQSVIDVIGPKLICTCLSSRNF